MILKKLLQITTIFLTILIISSPVYGQDSAADPRTKLETQLLLQIPSETDNPNFTITFTDPSQKGVTLSIDGGEYTTIVNPHTLPALGIGKHTLSFKFTDKEDSPQEAEVDIAVVPRPPTILPPELIDSSKLIVKGRALAASTVNIFMTGNSVNTFQKVETDNDGEWEFIFEQQFEPGVYAVTAYIKKNGFGSSYSEPVNFSLEGDTAEEVNTTSGSGPIYFRLDQINQNNIRSTLERNPDLVAYTLALLGTAFLVGVLLARALIRHDARISEAMFRSMLNKKSSSTPVPGPARQESVTSVPAREKRGFFSYFRGGKGKEQNSLKNKFEAAGFRKSAEEESSTPSPDQLALGVEGATLINKDEISDKTTKEQPKESSTRNPNPLKSLVTDLRPGKQQIAENDAESQSEKLNSDKQVEKEPVNKEAVKTSQELSVDTPDSKPTLNQSLSKDEFLKRFKDFDPDRDDSSLQLKEELRETGIVTESTETEPETDEKTPPAKPTQRPSKQKKRAGKVQEKPKKKSVDGGRSKDKSIKITLTSGSFSK